MVVIVNVARGVEVGVGVVGGGGYLEATEHVLWSIITVPVPDEPALLRLQAP